jgi:hypothetical protein
MNEDISFDTLLREATQSVEAELSIEDKGWLLLSGTGGETISADKRISSVKQSRLYYALDPLARQSIRLWTDYTFGPGMSWEVDESEAKQTKAVLDAFWYSRDNQPVFGSRGQRKCSEKLLVDGEIFFAVFLGKESRVRTIDPLEITEIITDVDDIEYPMFYKRMWTDQQSQAHTDYYRSYLNIKNQSAKDWAGANIQKTQDALVYHLAYNTTGQRGNPLLLPALDWIKQYRRFLAARVAMTLARTRFAWKNKIVGGAAAAAAVKATYDGKIPEAAAMAIENQAADLQPIQTPQDARNAYDDARILKLQVCAAVGIPEQYYGDIATGNLATAKTVELPMLKMFQSYQSVWSDTYQDLFELILEYNRVPPNEWYVDKTFPTIAPEDVFSAAQALTQIITTFPEFALAPDVQQMALMTLGINDPSQVLDSLAKESKGNVNVKLAKALRELKKIVEKTNV